MRLLMIKSAHKRVKMKQTQRRRVMQLNREIEELDTQRLTRK
jgi:hypothetical protein